MVILPEFNIYMSIGRLNNVYVKYLYKMYVYIIDALYFDNILNICST